MLTIKAITTAAGRLCTTTRLGGFYFLSVDKVAQVMRTMPSRMAPAARQLVERLQAMPHSVRRIGLLREAIEIALRTSDMAKRHLCRAAREREVADARRAVVMRILSAKAGTLLGGVP